MKKTDWEKELDERFDVEYPYIFEERNELKAFIRSQRSQLLKSLVEEVEKLPSEHYVILRLDKEGETIPGKPVVNVEDVIKLLEKYETNT